MAGPGAVAKAPRFWRYGAWFAASDVRSVLERRQRVRSRQAGQSARSPGRTGPARPPCCAASPGALKPDAGRDQAARPRGRRVRPADPRRYRQRPGRRRLLPRPVGGRAPGADGLRPRHPDPLAVVERDDRAPWSLDGARDQVPPTLSSGQRRRLALASCFVRPRRLLVLDEPEQRLDAGGASVARRAAAAGEEGRYRSDHGLARSRAGRGGGRHPPGHRRLMTDVPT